MEPIRSCVGCGQRRDKRQLLRIVRTPEGAFLLDETGEACGRGAYLCGNEACLVRAKKRGSLMRSFRAAIPQADLEELYRTLEDRLGGMGET